ncbi:hypothetical protein D104_03390 [Marinomonas profundimaris]|uniref:Uncharacterized protein n=1 Tax=Marinomonas profundimaris TaxID=1208321 RepID=W1S1U3_9GAMM|nr:hypothetical protein D104_03390 [Marinomonas profundimaris]
MKTRKEPPFKMHRNALYLVFAQLEPLTINKPIIIQFAYKYASTLLQTTDSSINKAII